MSGSIAGMADQLVPSLVNSHSPPVDLTEIINLCYVLVKEE